MILAINIRLFGETGQGYSPIKPLSTMPLVSAAVTLYSPANNSTGIPVKPSLVWRKTTYADRYHLQVSDNALFSNIVYNDSTLADTSKLVDSLLYGKSYYWRVRGGNIAGYGTFSSPAWKFTTQAMPIPVPGNLKAVAAVYGRVRLTWNDNSQNESGFVILRKNGDSTSSNQMSALDTVSANLAEFTDSTIADSFKYSYRVYAFSADTVSGPSNYAVVVTLTSVKEYANGTLPDEYTIMQNYPNPFNPSTTIRYGLPYASEVRIEIYDMTGQKLRTLIEKEQNAGFYEAVFDIDGLSSGTYFYVLTARQLEGENKSHQVKKMILMK